MYQKSRGRIVSHALVASPSPIKNVSDNRGFTSNVRGRNFPHSLSSVTRNERGERLVTGFDEEHGIRGERKLGG